MNTHRFINRKLFALMSPPKSNIMKFPTPLFAQTSSDGRPVHLGVILLI